MARQAIKIPKSFNTGNEGFVPLQTNRFAPQLYSNLIIAQESMGYSIAIQYVKKYILDRLPKNYLRSFHINGKHMFDDFRIFNKQNVKKEKPMAVLLPSVDYDYDRENLDMYGADATTFLKRSDYQRSFFKDYQNRVFLGLQMHALKMNFTFKVRVGTRAEQIDLFRKMELVFKIGATHAEDISCDFVIPYELVRNIAALTGFEVDDKGEVVDPLDFLAYLNKHSDIPVTYKFRSINGHNEFFLRLSHMYTHLNFKDKLNVEDGEREGQLENSFDISMQFILKIPTPQFFVLYNERPIMYPLEMEKGNLLLCSLSQFTIPDTNERGWNQVINTVYMIDDGEDVFDIHEMFLSNQTTDIRKVINYCIGQYISPKVFIDLKIYKELAGTYVTVPCELEYRSQDEILIKLGEKLPSQYLYIGIYIDMEFVNNTAVTVNEFNKNRLQSPEYPKP